MKPAGESLWSLIATAANDPEVEEIAYLVGKKRIEENEVSKDHVALDCFSFKDNVPYS